MTRVCILGVGVVTASGRTLDATWASLIAGESSVAPLSFGDLNGHVIATETSENRLADLAVEACDQVFAQVQRGSISVDAVCIGSSSAGFSDNSAPNSLVSRVSDYYGIPNVCQISQACSSSSYAIATAVDLIRLGDAQVVLAGGVDEVTPSVVESFDACRIYSDMCRPFDTNRKGVVLGEASAFFLLADELVLREHRYLSAHGYIDGIGLTCDAHDPVGTWDGGISRAVEAALGDAEYSTVNFICAHGTGTRDNDATESRVITGVFGVSAAPPVASYKGALGHPQGASGAVGLALVLQAMKSHTIFGTVGLQTVDADIDIKVTNTATSTVIDTALVLSYGSWGTNSALVVSR